MNNPHWATLEFAYNHARAAAMLHEHSPTDDVSIDDLAAEFARKCRSGGCPSVTQYATRYPGLAEEIKEIFPAIAMLEQYSRKTAAERADTRRFHAIEHRLLDSLGDYRIVRQIGRGGMGVVYEAIQESLGRTVALKVLTVNVAQAPQQLARFRREAQAAAMLHHTNIVPIFGVGHDDGLHYYVMQFIDGIGLDRLIPRQRSPDRQPDTRRVEPPADRASADTAAQDFSADILSIERECPDSGLSDPVSASCTIEATNPPALFESDLTWDRIADYGVQIAQAVDYAHNQGIVHRDIKPANLLVDTHGTVWVTDFGLAKVFGDEALTQSGDVFGTIRYMAPEQFEGHCTRSTDIYSIGVTLYELATGQPAFEGGDAKQLIHAITQQGVPRPRNLRRPLPKDLETIIMKAAAFEPRHRYATAGQLADDLRRFQLGEPISARRASYARRVWRWSCRNPALAALSSLSVLLLVLVAAVASIGLMRVEEARRKAMELAGREQQRAAELKIATQRAQRESDRARDESQRAEDNLQLAMRAFEEVIARVSERGLPESLELELDDQDRGAPSALFTDDDAELLQSLCTFYEEFASRNQADESVQWETAKAHHRIGDIRHSLGQFDQATAAYGDAIRIYERLAQGNLEELGVVLQTADAWNQLGVAHMRSGQIRESIEAHTAARDLLLQQSESVAMESEIRFALADTYNHLGAIWYRANITGIPFPRRGPVGPPGHRSIGRAGRAGMMDWMEENYRCGLELLEELLEEDPSNVRYRLALARCYRNRLPLSWHGGSVEEAAAALLVSVSILQRLVDDCPDTPRYAFELADVLSIDTPELRHTEFGKSNWQRLEQAEEIARRLNNTYPHQPEYKTLYANTLYRFGLIIHRHGEEALGERHLIESLKHYEDLLQQFPSVPAYVASLAQVAIDLSDMQWRAGEYEESYETLDNAMLELIATYDPAADMVAARRFIAILQMNLHLTGMGPGRGPGPPWRAGMSPQ